MDYWCYICIFFLTPIILLYILFELHYFLRMCLCVFLARFVKRKCHILETTIVSGICLTNDIDTLLYHMNNARYLRELDFARVDFYERTNLYRTIVAKGGSVYQGAATIRYRRFIRPFHRFHIKSSIVYWDNESVFMEHKFLRPSDQFVHCIAICRQRIIDCSAEDVMAELLAPKTAQIEALNNTVSSTISLENAIVTTNIDEAERGQVRVKLKPDIPPEISKWMEYNDLSSKRLRKCC
ncbi:protein THEM6 [Teleopsis dalmanni]|uniref:protein THEM6 n=1 Tax=Teleopsis dalmanni TaxID=139649 RepID=UPI0018CD954D|nr:protein THEM6 [Teleopsis dalmanni]